jgi:hypothetical protein
MGPTYFRFFIIILTLASPLSAVGADLKMVPQLRSGSVAATAKENFTGDGKSQKTTVPEFASLPQTLQASASDQGGEERSAQGEIRLDIENGALRFEGKLKTTDAKPTDFVAPLASVKGAVVLDLKAIVPGDQKAGVKARFKLVTEGPAALIGGAGETPVADNITIQVRLNDELILKPEDFFPAGEKEVSLTLRSGDVVTLFFQVDFSVFSAEQAQATSALRYSFLP